jgi:hypothetical protein
MVIGQTQPIATPATWLGPSDGHYLIRKFFTSAGFLKVYLQGRFKKRNAHLRGHYVSQNAHYHFFSQDPPKIYKIKVRRFFTPCTALLYTRTPP